VTPIHLKPNISKTAGYAIYQQSLDTIACCESVRSAILATAWLLVQCVGMFCRCTCDPGVSQSTARRGGTSGHCQQFT